MQDQLDKLEGRVRHLEDELKTSNGKLTDALAFVRYAEGLMEAKGIKFKPFSFRPSGSETNIPLPSGPSENPEDRRQT